MNQYRNIVCRHAAKDVTLAGLLSVLAATSLLLTGCGKDNFARVNGQTVTKDEYVKALERQQVALPGGQPPTNAERAVLDELITNKIIVAEAAKELVLPSDAEVESYYTLQKTLFEQQMPSGKDFDTVMRDQGTTPEDIKNGLKIQLASTALYAKELKLGEADVRKVYDNAHGQFGLPARVLLRLILVAPNSPDFSRAKQMLDAKTDFNQVAKEVNGNATLKASDGLLSQFTPISQITPKYQPAIQQAKVGDVIGPINFQIAANQPTAKAWIKIEEKRPAYNVPYESAAPLIRQQLVQFQMQQPANVKIKNEIINAKLNASFEPTTAIYGVVWDAIKKSAKDAGVGQAPAMPAGAGMTAAPAGSGAALGGGATEPATAPAAQAPAPPAPAAPPASKP